MPNSFLFAKNGRHQVIGEFVCNNIDNHTLSNLIVKEDAKHTLSDTCLTKEEVLNYLGYQKGTSIYDCKNYDFYGWHISNLIIYDKPRGLSEFSHTQEYVNKIRNSVVHWEYGVDDEVVRPIKRPPQSWCYVELKKG